MIVDKGTKLVQIKLHVPIKALAAWLKQVNISFNSLIYKMGTIHALPILQTCYGHQMQQCT